MAFAEWKTAPNPEDVRRLRAAVSEYAADVGLEPQRVDDVALAVSEIVSNAIMHAYRDGGDGTITVVAQLDGQDVLIRVHDDGMGMSPRDDSPGAGLGLSIAGHVADRIEIERPHAGGTAVCLTFAAAA